MALLLIASGVNPNVAPHRSSALEKAISNGLTRVTLALLRAGADANRCDSFSPARLLLAAARGNFEVVRALLDVGANINVTGDVMVGESTTPAFNEADDTHIVMNIGGILSDQMLAQGSTALVVAVRRGDYELVKLLFERCADPNLGDRRGKTPLAWAVDTHPR